MGRKSQRKPSRRRKKRQFLGNQFVQLCGVDGSDSDESSEEEVADHQPTPLSASERKLSEIPAWVYKTSSSDEQSLPSNPDSDDFCDEDEFYFSNPNATEGHRLVSLTQLQNIFTSVAVCKFCKTGEILLSEAGREGLVSTINFQCSNSCSCISSMPLEEKTGRFLR